MAVSTDSIKQRYPLPAYNYRVTILPISVQNIPAGTELGNLAATQAQDAIQANTPGLANLAGDLATISCSSVSGLTMELDTVTYRHGLSFLTGQHIIPAQIKEVNLSIKKGVTTNSRYLSDWISLVYPTIKPLPLGLTRKRDILIDLCDETGSPVVRWVVIKAMPVQLTAPDFDANTNEVAFEELKLVAHQLKVDYITSGEIIQFIQKVL